MNRIEFFKVSNIFINIGIIALHRYIEKYITWFPDKYKITKNELEKNKLIVECDELIPMLENVYYFMGKEFYDTSTKKQLDTSDKYYFEKNPFKVVPFAKIKTLGFASTLTGNPPVTKGKEGEKIKFDKLYENEFDFAYQIAEFLKRKNKKLKFYTFENGKLTENEKDNTNNKRKENRGGDSEIFINAGYTTIPNLDFNEKLLETGKLTCPVINESFQKLIENKSSSAFLSGLTNFNTFFTSDNYISWKALYLLRFSPALAFYSYQENYETLICSFFNSNNLQNINLLYDEEMFRPKTELEHISFKTNFNLVNFSYKKKNKETFTVSSSDDVTWSSEISFMLLYTFYKRNFEKEFEDNEIKIEQIMDPFKGHPLEKIPLSLITFRADKFASTMRPNEYEEYNNVKYMLRLIHLLENNKNFKAPIRDIWQGLKLITPKSKALKFEKRKSEERKIRANIFKNILIGKSIINDIETLFFNSYKYRISNENTGYRNYKILLNFLIIYEQTIINKTKNMDKNLQQRAINLGKSIGQGIIKFNNEDKKANAKNGRKYLIGLHKSRTLEQFLENLYRIMNKYHVCVSNEILENIDKNNFQLIRQYALISALNQINSVL